MTITEFVQICAANGLTLDDGQVTCFAAYADTLAAWNAKVNLVSRKDLDNVWERHMLHSVALLFHAEIAPGARVADIGTGGGFPGIPLKICRPDVSMTLIDSIKKKIGAVDAMIRTLYACDRRMDRVRTVCGRAEDLAEIPALRAQHDVVVARAVAPLIDLVTWAKPLLAAHGTLLALKGGPLDAEVAAVRILHPVLSVTCMPLTVQGVPQFAIDEKQLITVQW